MGLPNAVVGFWGPVGGNCRGAVPVFVVDTEAKGGLRARLGNTVGIVTLFGKEHAQTFSVVCCYKILPICPVSKGSSSLGC